MSFPRKPDNTFDFDAYAKLPKKMQEQLLTEVEAANVPEEYEQLEKYFEQQANRAQALLSQLDTKSAELIDRNRLLEKQNALIMSETTTKVINKIQHGENRKDSKCVVS